jgi:hypothetical protein
MVQSAHSSPLQQIRYGYGALLRSIMRTLLLLLIILGLSVAITLPLWYFALNFRNAFTAVMLVLLGAYLLLSAGKRLLLRLRSAERPLRERLKGAAGKAGRSLGLVAFVYLFLALLSGPMPLLTVPFTIIGLLGLGYIFFVGRR